MTATMTANYKEIFSAETVEKIDELVEDNYALDDILEFLKEYNGDDLIAYYVDYVIQGDKVGWYAVDAFLEENDISDVPRVEDVYVGQYDSEADFAESYYDDNMNVPSELVIDWAETFQYSLSNDYDYVNGFVFLRNW
jgi:antirestriction protein